MDASQYEVGAALY